MSRPVCSTCMNVIFDDGCLCDPVEDDLLDVEREKVRILTEELAWQKLYLVARREQDKNTKYKIGRIEKALQRAKELGAD